MILKNTFLVTLLIFTTACATTYPRVDQDLETYDTAVARMKNEFSKTTLKPESTAWIKAKLDHMFEIDQYMRNFWSTPVMFKYTKDERDEFNKKFITRSNQMDQQNTADIKKLLENRDWFKISEFGAKGDDQAWIIVQHADHDIQFQKDILSRLEKLLPLKETKPANYAYLYDRVLSSPADPSKMKPQKYGTQGHCTGPGEWQPWPIEDEINLDKRRKTMGMTSFAEYKELFKDLCH